MRNRTRSKKTEEGDSDSNSPEPPAELVGIQATQASPRVPLVRTTTREEITQTDDNPAFMQGPPKKNERPWMQYRRFIFILGCILGVALAWAFRSPDLQLEGLLDSLDMADFFDDIKAALPSALPISLVREAREIQEHTRQTAGTGAFSIGEQMLRDGMSAHHPVIMVRPRRFVHLLITLGSWSNIHGTRKLVYD
jgi:hypothetical protein